MSRHQGTTITDLESLVSRVAPVSEADDKCEACGQETATREAVHGEIDGKCELEEQ